MKENELLRKFMRSILSDVSEMKKLYNAHSREYDAIFRDIGFSAPYYIAEALSEIRIDKKISILDFGSGTGLHGEQLTSLGFSNISALDLCENMLEIAREKNIYSEIVHDHDGMFLNEKYETYDAITASGVFTGAIPIEPEKLSDMMNCLVEGGHLLFNWRENEASIRYVEKMTQLTESGVCIFLGSKNFFAFDKMVAMTDAENQQEVMIYQRC